MDLDSGIWVVCNPVIEVDGVRRVSLSTAAWCGVADVVCGSAVDCASSDNMGNNESNGGVLPAREGTSFTKFPTVEEERVTFLLYYMSINPKAIINMPITTNVISIILGDKLKG